MGLDNLFKSQEKVDRWSRQKYVEKGIKNFAEIVHKSSSSENSIKRRRRVRLFVDLFVVLLTYTNVCGVIILELHFFSLSICVSCGSSRSVTNRHPFWRPVTDRVYWTCMIFYHILLTFSGNHLTISNMSSTTWICQDTFWFWWPTSSGFMEVMRSGHVLLWQSWWISSASLNTPPLIGKSEIYPYFFQTQYPVVQQYNKIPVVIPDVKQCCNVALEWRKRSR